MNLFEHLEAVSRLSGWPMQRILQCDNHFDRLDLAASLAKHGEDALISHWVVQNFRDSEAYRKASATA